MKSFLHACGALMLVSCVLAPSAMAQKPGGTIEVGGWSIDDSREANGSFASCSAHFTWDDKSTIGFVRSKADTAVIMYEPTAKLVKDKIYPVSLQIDDNKAVLGMASALSAQTVIVMIPQPEPMLAQLAAGNTLYLEVDGVDHNNPLQGSANALKALQACLVKGLGS